MLLERLAILKIKKGNSSLLSKDLLENSVPLTFKYRSKSQPSCYI